MVPSLSQFLINFWAHATSSKAPTGRSPVVITHQIGSENMELVGLQKSGIKKVQKSDLVDNDDN